jgi:hypothetical protein
MSIARIKILLISIAVLALGLLYYLYNPVGHSFFPECPFYALTGLDCPGCGSQRALYALLHGHLLQAAAYNLLFVLALPFIIYSAVVFAGNHLFGKRWNQNIFYKPWFAKVALVFILLFWILRNLPFPCFHWMAA